MTINEFIVKLDKKVADIKLFSEPLRIAAFDTTARMSNRIFDSGQKTDGSEMEPGYSTKPIYVNPETLTTNKAIGVLMGKYGDKVFKAGKKKGQSHKTKYLEGGYYQLRQKVGRQINYIDLKFSGELRMDFNNTTSENQPAEPRQINELEYQIRLDKQINQDKRGGMEKKYGEIFSLSEEEKTKFFDVIGFEFRKAMSK